MTPAETDQQDFVLIDEWTVVRNLRIEVIGIDVKTDEDDAQDDTEVYLAAE